VGGAGDVLERGIRLRQTLLNARNQTFLLLTALRKNTLGHRHAVADKPRDQSGRGRIDCKDQHKIAILVVL